MDSSENVQWQQKTFGELANGELYGILALRAEVFVVEQACAYQDQDGKDPQSVHLMASAEGQLMAYARLLPPGLSYETASIGRIVVRRAMRGTGLGRQLVGRALAAAGELFGHGPVTISAQAHLEAFYAALGFEKQGAPYLEDGIPHIQMISAGLPAGNPG